MSRRLLVPLMVLASLLAMAGGATGASSSGPDSLGDGAPVGPLPPLGAAPSAAGPSSPSTPVLDNFNRPDGPLGGNWTKIHPNTGNLVIQSNVARQLVVSGSAAWYWAPAQFGPDAEVHARTIGTGCCNFPKSLHLLLRLRDVGTTSWDGYALQARTDIQFFTWYIQKYVNGSPSTLAQVNTGVFGWMMFRAVGSSLEGWGSNDGINWSPVISATDTQWQAGGYLGMGIVNTEPTIDDFSGGTVASAPPPELGFGVPDGRCGSVGCAPTATMVEPVNTFSGAYLHNETDLSLASAGVPFELIRSYTSADTASGRFGPGWTDTYQASVAIQGNGDAIVKGDEGQRIRFPSQGGGVFGDPPGSRAALTTIAGGYRLTRTDQVVYEFDTAGKLVSKKDRNGQGVILAYDGSARLTTVTDSAGNTATFSYNASNLVSGVALSDGRSTSYGHTSGRLTSFTDVRGKQWTYGYDAGGRLTTITDPLSHAQVTNVYDPTSGRVTSQTDATGRTVQFAWDAGTQTATMTDNAGHAWKDVYVNGVLFNRIDGTNHATEFGFDLDFNGTSIESPLGETTSMSFDAAGNMLTATAPPSLQSAQKTFVYNGRNDPTTVTDARGKVTSYTYTAAGNVETVTQDGVLVASYTYFPDGSGRVQDASDGNGKTTSYAYDGDGNVASVTGPDPDAAGPLGRPKTTYTYDGQGNVLTRVDPKGNVTGCGCASQYTTTFTYNAAGQLLTETNPLGHVTTNVYDDAGRLASATNENGRTTEYVYDNANRLLRERLPDPDGGGPLPRPETVYTYDAAGNKQTETDPRGNVTSYEYDNANRLTSVTAPDPDGGGAQPAPLTTYTYDVNGNLQSMVEPRGNVPGCGCAAQFTTTYTYDAAGRLLNTTAPDADGPGPLGPIVTTNVYDKVGNLQTLTDPNGHVTSYTHDYAGRILTVTAPDPDGGGPKSAPVTTYTYDPAGNQLTRRDANNRVTTSVYDALNRPVSMTSPDPDGGGAQTPSVTTSSYDINGNRLTLTDANGNNTPVPGDGTTTYGYDRANRMTSIDYSDTTPDVTFVLNNVGSRTSMADGSGTETRSYDQMERLTTVTRSGSSLSYVYDAASNITRRTYTDGTIVDYAYDPLNRMASVASGGRTIAYGYDAASNLVTATLPAANGYVETRTYDNAGRLSGVKHQKGASVLADIVYTRDHVGNPLTETRSGASPVTKTFNYDNMHRLTGVCFQAGSCPGGVDPFIRWDYDGVGNRLTEQRPSGTTSYTYDAMDRMLTAGATSYTYDRNGNQLSAGTRTFAWDLANRLRTTAASGTTTTYSYDGEGKRLQASTGSGNNAKTNFVWDPNNGLPMLVREGSGNNGLLRRYVNGLSGPLFMSTSGSNAFYYHPDALGSTRNVTDTAGATQLTYDYEPYGAVRSQTGSLANFVKFTGQYHDPTGLYHLRARQYDAAVGRFLGIDPVPPRTLASLVSPYLYVTDRPTVLADPTGLTGQPAEGNQEATFAVLDATSPSGTEGPRPSVRIIGTNVLPNPRNPTQLLYWYLVLMNNAASRDFLFQPVQGAAFDKLIDEAIVSPIIEQLLKDLVPRIVLTSATLMQDLFALANVSAALGARRDRPVLVAWVRAGRRLKLLDVGVFQISPRGIYLYDVVAHLCTADLPCTQPIVKGIR